MLIYPGRLFKTWTTIPTTIPVMAMAAGIAMLMIHFIVFNSARRDSMSDFSAARRASIFAPSAPISALVAKCVICSSKFAIRSPSVLVCTTMRVAPLFKIEYDCSIADMMISRKQKSLTTEDTVALRRNSQQRHCRKRKNRVSCP